MIPVQTIVEFPMYDTFMEILRVGVGVFEEKANNNTMIG